MHEDASDVTTQSTLEAAQARIGATLRGEVVSEVNDSVEEEASAQTTSRNEVTEATQRRVDSNRKLSESDSAEIERSSDDVTADVTTPAAVIRSRDSNVLKEDEVATVGRVEGGETRAADSDPQTTQQPEDASLSALFRPTTARHLIKLSSTSATRSHYEGERSAEEKESHDRSVTSSTTTTTTTTASVASGTFATATSETATIPAKLRHEQTATGATPTLDARVTSQDGGDATEKRNEISISEKEEAEDEGESHETRDGSTLGNPVNKDVAEIPEENHSQASREAQMNNEALFAEKNVSSTFEFFTTSSEKPQPPQQELSSFEIGNSESEELFASQEKIAANWASVSNAPTSTQTLQQRERLESNSNFSESGQTSASQGRELISEDGEEEDEEGLFEKKVDLVSVEPRTATEQPSITPDASEPMTDDFVDSRDMTSQASSNFVSLTNDQGMGTPHRLDKTRPSSDLDPSTDRSGLGRVVGGRKWSDVEMSGARPRDEESHKRGWKENTTLASRESEMTPAASEQTTATRTLTSSLSTQVSHQIISSRKIR